jgi:hypothetical protein
MPPIRARPWILLPIILVWSLGATGALAQSPGAPPAASPSTLDPLIEDVLAGALEDPAAIAVREAALRHGERAALGVAAIDPELPDIMDELDAIAAEVLGGCRQHRRSRVGRDLHQPLPGRGRARGHDRRGGE